MTVEAITAKPLPAPARAVLTAVAAILYGTAWLVGRIVYGLAIPVGWAWAALRLGYGDGRGR